MSNSADGATEVKSDTNELPGDAGVWFFICADMSTFAAFFVFFTLERLKAVELFEASRLELSTNIGLLNTLILLTSGAFMAQAVHQARRENWQAARKSLIFTLASGSLFAVTKAWEWGGKIAEGINLTTNEFYIYYFTLTGVHFLHFIIGVCVLVVLIKRCSKPLLQEDRLRWMESGGAYWHMVDLLWVVLFAMLYLQRV